MTQVDTVSSFCPTIEKEREPQMEVEPIDALYESPASWKSAVFTPVACTLMLVRVGLLSVACKHGA